MTGPIRLCLVKFTKFKLCFYAFLYKKIAKIIFDDNFQKNYFYTKIKHKIPQPKIKSDNTKGNLITAVLQENSMKEKKRVWG